MTADSSRGWEAAAEDFLRTRSDVGAETVRRWAKQLPPHSSVLDVGCGSGAPVSAILIGEGFEVFGVDASPTLVAQFRRRFPSAQAACEPAETSDFFGRQFDGAVAIGLLFLLPAHSQRRVIKRVARALKPGGRFLFTAPRHACRWKDTLTGRVSVSLGEPAYRDALDAAGLRLSGHDLDEGGNEYFSAVRP